MEILWKITASKSNSKINTTTIKNSVISINANASINKPPIDSRNSKVHRNKIFDNKKLWEIYRQTRIKLTSKKTNKGT